jgi:outer membrane protein assembly factor BamA
MKREVYHIQWLKACYAPLLILALATLFASCNPAKRLESGQYLLTKNNVVYQSQLTAKPQKNNLINNNITAIPGSEIQKLALPPELAVNQILAYVKQKPNTKILGGIPLHLLVYNLVDPEKMKEKRVLKDRKIDEKNKKIEEKNIIREQKDKKPRPYKSKEPKAFSREWVRGVGEAPVILDSVYMAGSVEQIRRYLHTKGYFDASVRDSVHVKGNYAEVFYIIRQGKPYTINRVTYELDDTTLANVIYKDSVNSLIRDGANYDEDALKNERDRITKVLKDDGYYAFSKEYIHYDIDTNASTKKASITIGIKKYAYLYAGRTDSVIETLHSKYFIRRVIIQMGYNPVEPNYVASDTTFSNGYIITYPHSSPEYHPHSILSKIYIKPGDMYESVNVENTYSGLSQLKAFRYVNIHWVPLADSNKLDCYIQLMPNTKLSMALEAVGNNTGGDWGLQGDVLYQDNNLLKGAEILQVKLKGAWEAQTLISGSNTNNGDLSKGLTLNTFEIGPDISLSVPRPLNVFNLIRINPAIANPQTAFRIIGDYQNQPSYQRYIVTGSYGYDWNCWKHDHMNITLFEVNYVNAINSQAFIDNIIATGNFFLRNSFTTHAITDGRVTWIFNNQALTKLRNFDYLKISGEWSGFLLHLVDHWLNQPDQIIANPYSHYVKADIDYRHYIVLSKDDKLAFRFLAGAGLPLLNDAAQELPFDKSYWAGGSNDIRAWAARTLGPGASNQSLVVAQVGDIKLEANEEYRLNVIKFFGLAFFLDEGNIWLLNKNPSVLHGEFELSGRYGFLNELAVGTGVGFRFDFTYFVFRVDLGLPLVDPTKDNSWSLPQIHDTFVIRRLAVNYGIGFPF